MPTAHAPVRSHPALPAPALCLYWPSSLRLFLTGFLPPLTSERPVGNWVRYRVWSGATEEATGRTGKNDLNSVAADCKELAGYAAYVVMTSLSTQYGLLSVAGR